MPGYEIFGDEERKEAQDVLNSGVLFRYAFEAERQGQWKAETFEQELSQKFGIRYAHLCSSGTTALDIALACCGVGVGDEVIVPPFTFVATIESVLNAGAIPIFAEIDETLCLDPVSVKAAISGRTKAVLLVHMCGSMARIDEIKAICDQNHLMLIEDACQSIGATFKGKALGTFGKIGCFSFDPLKTITCGEGGAVVTDDENLFRLASAYADHGHDHLGDIRANDEHPILGTNYRICELNAAVGLAQFRKLDRMLKQQRMYKKMMRDALSQCSCVCFSDIPDDAGDSATFLSIFLENEDQARETARTLSEAGLDSFFYWYDANWHYVRKWHHLKNMTSVARLPLELAKDVPDYSQLELPRSDSIMGRTISFQMRLSWTPDDVKDRMEKMLCVLKGE